jgi:hypothetical protein
MVFSPYPNNPLNEILPYGSTKHFVSVVWNRQHYKVLYYDIDKRFLTVFDGLNQDIRKWKDHIIHTVKTYGLKPLFTSATCEFRYEVYVNERVRKRTKLERRDMALEICLMIRKMSHGIFKTSNPTCKVMVSVVAQSPA